MKIAKHVLLFLVCLGVVCSLRVGWAEHFARDLRRVVAEAAENRSRELEAQWRRQSYTRFSAEAIVSAMWSKVPRSSLPLSEDQRGKLERRLLEVLRYFEQPTFDEYYRLKTGGFHWRFEPAAYAGELLARSTTNSSRAQGSLDTKSLVRILWEQVHPEPALCLPRLTGICLDTVATSTTATNSVRALLTGKINHGFTVAQEAINPGFVYGAESTLPSPQVFQVGFLAKANGLEDSGPVYMSLVWVERDQEWALSRLLTDRWLHIKTLF